MGIYTFYRKVEQFQPAGGVEAMPHTAVPNTEKVKDLVSNQTEEGTGLWVDGDTGEKGVIPP